MESEAAIDRPLQGRVVLVTGGAGGIGAAAARAFASRGARVVVLDRDVAGGRVVANELGEQHAFLELDVSDPAAWTSSLAAVADMMGRIDIVCLNAGVMSRPIGAPIHDDAGLWFTLDVYRRLVAVNQDGVAFGAIASLPYLKRTQGAIVMTASGVGVKPLAADPLYAMTKHAVVGLGSSLAGLAAQHSVRVNVFCPTATDTALVAPDQRGGEWEFMRPADAGALLADVAMLPTGGGIWLVVPEPPRGALRSFDSEAAFAAATVRHPPDEPE